MDCFGGPSMQTCPRESRSPDTGDPGLGHFRFVAGYLALSAVGLQHQG